MKTCSMVFFSFILSFSALAQVNSSGGDGPGNFKKMNLGPDAKVFQLVKFLTKREVVIDEYGISQQFKVENLSCAGSSQGVYAVGFLTGVREHIDVECEFSVNGELIKANKDDSRFIYSTMRNSNIFPNYFSNAITKSQTIVCDYIPNEDEDKDTVQCSTTETEVLKPIEITGDSKVQIGNVITIYNPTINAAQYSTIRNYLHPDKKTAEMACKILGLKYSNYSKRGLSYKLNGGAGATVINNDGSLENKGGLSYLMATLSCALNL